MKSTGFLYGAVSLMLMAAVAIALLCFAFDPTVAHAAAGGALATGTGGFAKLGAAMIGRMTIAQMREKRTGIVREMRDMLDKSGDAAWTPEQTTAYDAKDVEVQALDTSMAREQRLLDLSADAAFKAAGGTELDAAQSDAKKLYSKWLRGGDKALNADDWAHLRNTMSTTTSGQGGYTVQSDVAKELIDSLKAYGGMRETSEVFQTAQGNPLSFPTSDGTSETGELIAENTTATAADPSFGTVAVNAFKFSSKVVAVPFELLQDSSIDMEAFIRARLGVRLGRITNQMFTTGTGTAQPRGIVTGASSGKVGTTGQTLTVIYDDLIDLQHSVDPAYRRLPGAGFVMADSSLKVIRKIKDGQSRPIFVPGYETNVPGGMPDMLLGSPLSINQDVPAMAADAKSILFGALKKYLIRDVMEIAMFRFEDSAYIKLGQIGFMAWMRSGGNLTDTAAVKYYQNSST